MKKSALLIFSFLLVILSSCEDDDSVLGPNSSFVTGNNVTNIELTIATDAPLIAEGESLPVTVTLPRTFEVDVIATGVSQLSDLRTASSTILIPAGSTTGEGSINLPGADMANTNSFDAIASFSISGIFADDGAGTLYTATSNTIEVSFMDRFPDTAVNAEGDPGGISIAVEWNSGDDYDFIVVNNGSFLSGNDGATANSIEVMTLSNDVVPDGLTELVHIPFSKTSMGDINYRMVIKETDRFGEITTTYYDGLFAADQNDPDVMFPILEITKTTTVDNSDPSNVQEIAEYTFVQL